MDRESVRDFVRVSLDEHDIKDEGEWVMTHCPLAHWTHDQGTDRSMSFGIKVNEYDQSIFHCFTCKEKGTLKHLLKTLSRYSGEDYEEDIDGLDADEFLNARLPDWGKRKTVDSKRHGLPTPVDADYLDIYDPAAGHEYLRSRGIDDATADFLGLVVDPDDHGCERILFPVFDLDGNFYGYTGRATDRRVEPRIRDYFGLPKRHLLLGAEKLNGDYVVLVEGLFDYARVSMFDPGKVCAVMHSGVTPQQAKILKDFDKPVYVMFDNDKAGRQGAQQVKQELGRHIPLMKVRYPLGVNDPGELEKDEYFKMLNDARLL